MNNEQLYANIKAGFVAKLTTLNKWCIKNKKHRQNVRAAVLGEWQGEEATLLVDLVIKESGVTLSCEEERKELPFASMDGEYSDVS